MKGRITKHGCFIGGYLLLGTACWAGLIALTYGTILLVPIVVRACRFAAQHPRVLHLKHNGLPVSGEQFSETSTLLETLCKKIGVAKPPQAFVGDLNDAPLTELKPLRKRYWHLSSDFLVCFQQYPGVMAFQFASRLAQRHHYERPWHFLILPATYLPIIGSFYQRYKTYHCDRIAMAACEQPTFAAQGIGANRCHYKLYGKLDPFHTLKRLDESSRFLQSLIELISGEPSSARRLAKLAYTNPAVLDGTGETPALEEPETETALESTAQAENDEEQPASEETALATTETAQGARTELPAYHIAAWLIVPFFPRIAFTYGAILWVTCVTLTISLGTMWMHQAEQKRLAKINEEKALRASIPSKQWFHDFYQKMAFAKDKVTEYHNSFHVFPANNSEINMSMLQEDKKVDAVLIKKGAILIRLKSLTPEGQHRVLSLVPYVDNQQVKWDCAGRYLPQEVLPPNCY